MAKYPDRARGYAKSKMFKAGRRPIEGSKWMEAKERGQVFDRWFDERVQLIPTATLKYSTKSLYEDYGEWFDHLSMNWPHLLPLLIENEQSFGMFLHHKALKGLGLYHMKSSGIKTWRGIALRPKEAIYAQT